MSGHETAPRGSWRIDLVELVAVVIGYGLAGVLFRAFWPGSGIRPVLGLFAVGFYSWLGMAMSGPLLLLRRAPQSHDEADASRAGQPATEGSRTWAEMAWLVIGVYWIVLGVFVLPIRLHDFRMRDTVLFGAVPLVAGLIMRFFGPGSRATDSTTTRLPWTHHAAVALLATWPVAWICLIVLGEAIL